MTIKTSLLSDITSRLAATSDTPALDASVLLACIMGRPRTWIMAHPELTLTSEQQQQLDNSLGLLAKGKPFPFVLGRWEFFGLEFEVTPDVLIPRPETELLVEKAIVWMQESPSRKTIADVGTGSGAIAVSLAVNLPNTKILATDISSKAVQVAKRNAEKHNVIDGIEFIECDLLPESNVKGLTFDLICTNLPYIPTAILHRLPIFGREPTLALDGGNDGFELIRRLLHVAPAWLAPKAMMLLEIEATLGEQAIQLAKESFPDAKINLHQDLMGHDRLLQIRT